MKISDFVPFPMFGFTSDIKLRNFHFESLRNTLRFFNKKHMASDLSMSHGKMSNFV